jgi:hypothetical protein
VAGSLTSRLARLERTRAESTVDICPQCGRLPNGEMPLVGTIRRKAIVMGHQDESQIGPEICPGCGNRRVFWLKIDRPGQNDDSDDGPGGAVALTIGSRTMPAAAGAKQQ